jgi:hypothetical protein
MAQTTENILRRSLDAVDRQRRRLTWVLAIAGINVAFGFYRLFEVKPTGDLAGLIVQAVMVLFFGILGLAVLMVFQLTISTKRILRAIELASRPAEGP